MFTQPLEEAIASTRYVLGNITPDQLDDDTPCASWKVRDVINHVVGTHLFFRGALTGTPPGGIDPASGDFMAAFDEATGACLDAFQADGVAERTFSLPFGELPGTAVAGLAATDTLTHGWDLAQGDGSGNRSGTRHRGNTAHRRPAEHPGRVPGARRQGSLRPDAGSARRRHQRRPARRVPRTPSLMSASDDRV